VPKRACGSPSNGALSRAFSLKPKTIRMWKRSMRARLQSAPEAHHDHLIDVETGKVIEFVDPELEALQRQIAEKLGFRLVDHRMELYGVTLDRKS
jgi:Fe2+ or Zn2+ uptake regulation protein